MIFPTHLTIQSSSQTYFAHLPKLFQHHFLQKKRWSEFQGGKIWKTKMNEGRLYNENEFTNSASEYILGRKDHNHLFLLEMFSILDRF